MKFGRHSALSGRRRLRPGSRQSGRTGRSSWAAGPRSNGTRRRSSRSAPGLPGGSMNACRRSGVPPSMLRSKEMRCCIWTSGATTSASPTAEQCSSTGTSCISEPRPRPRRLGCIAASGGRAAATRAPSGRRWAGRRARRILRVARRTPAAAHGSRRSSVSARAGSRGDPLGFARTRTKIRHMTDFMPLQGWDHVELLVGNAKQAAYYYEQAFGVTRSAYAGPETGVRDRASYVLEQGDIRFVLTSGLRAQNEVTEFACRHGDSAKSIGLQVPSAEEAYRQAVQRGARGIAEPRWVEDEFGRVELSAIGTYGEVIHTFVNRGDYAGPYLPGYRSTIENGQPPDGVGLIALDHVVGNVELGRMNHWVEFYERVFGMTNIVHFGDDQIQTEYSALMSKVMSDGSGKIKFPINEPAEGKRKSQIEEYIEFNHGPGVQHIALTSENVVQ